MLRKLASFVALVAVTGFALAAADQEHSTMGPKPGDAAPAFSLKDQSGKTVSLTDYVGKLVVLEWFNNECPFVQKHYTSGNMNKLASAYEAKGVVWLAINSGKGKTADDMKTVAADWKINRPILLDSEGAVGHAYGSKNTPTMYIINKDGKVAYRGAIDNKPIPDPASINGATNYVSKALDELLDGKSVSEPMTKAYGCNVKY